MRTDNIGAFARMHQQPTKGGNWRIHTFLVPYPGRPQASIGHTFYRATEIIDVDAWSRTHGSVIVERLSTHWLGQFLVTLCRESKDAGEVTKAQLTGIQEQCRAKYGKTLYTSRDFQRMAINLLWHLTFNEKHLLTDLD